MDKLDFLNNYFDAVCAFSDDNKIIFKNKSFLSSFAAYTTLERFKKHFNFNLCFLSLENLKNQTPIDLLLKSKENFHTICSYQNKNEEYIYYYIYTFIYENYKIAVFKDITTIDKMESVEKQYNKLKEMYDEVKESTEKFSKLKEHAQTQVLKMGIINRISLVIRETNDIKKILACALGEIHNLLGSFKTYFSTKEKNLYRIQYSVNNTEARNSISARYEDEVLTQIKNKNIVVTSCLKEALNYDDFLPKGVKRIIIPVYNKNLLLGIIVTFTKQKFQIDDNREILQSVSVQLASSIIQAGLIQQLNLKNKKLEKTLTELKDTQIQLINTEKMASIGQLVSGVAHEINTPLASISSNNNLINKILSSSSISSKELKILKDLNLLDIEAAKRISDIVKSLKRFVRLDEAEFQKADINKELDLTLKLITHELKNNIKIVKEYSNIPPVYCSVNMLNQVFMNLLVNACHSINSDKINGTITISTSSDDKNLIVKIRDNGVGIPLEIQNKIFNTGFTTKKIGIGTGLGLSISKKIIELHKGSISFTSKKNEGTEFTVAIPLNP